MFNINFCEANLSCVLTVGFCVTDLILFVQCGKVSADMTGTNAYDTAIKLIECQLFLHHLMFVKLS
jgi:hypothetical protein